MKQLARDSTNSTPLPVLIQGGMGVSVSNWRLAREVARAGQLGVVAGTALNTVLVRRLQDGDLGGEVRRAMEHFPSREYARDVLRRFFLEGGRAPGRPYASSGVSTLRSSLDSQRLSVVGGFVEVWLAKEGHQGLVGINFLEKLQLSNLPAMYGAMLAGVDVVLVGAGIPRDIPSALDALAKHDDASCRVALEADACKQAGDVVVSFSPRKAFAGLGAELRRPRFLAIVASASLAEYLLRHSSGAIDGFVVEGPSAGGHNAPPRGAQKLSERGEPIYGARDLPDAVELRALGRPFWLAGSWGAPERLARALELGASGVQVGTAFALCVESGLAPRWRTALLEKWVFGPPEAREPVFTDPYASPTRFPFKVAPLAGTLSDPAVYAARERICDLGYLRSIVRRADGQLVYRCPAEPVDDYVRKGGAREDTVGRKCLCNALLADIGLAQERADATREPPLLTAGDDLDGVRRFFSGARRELHAAELVRELVGS
jgi:nitronate monooxygenase